MLSECTWSEARTISQKSFEKLSAEEVSLSKSNQRVLATEQISHCDLPAYDTSGMDGWVTAGVGPWNIVGEIKMGTLHNGVLRAGECMKIATGGVIPVGGEAVIAWEVAAQVAGKIAGEPSLSSHIRPAGTECRKGERILDQGVRINSSMIGLLAATGHDLVSVTKKPKVALFFLGDELLHHGIPMGGSIRDSLGVQLPSILESLGAEVLSAEFIGDNLEELIVSAKSALENADVIITTGGTADGPRDFIQPAIANLKGEYLIDRVKVRPGYHVLLAKVTKKTSLEAAIPLLALPGNPQSALAAFFSFGRPLINSLLGINAQTRLTVELAEEMTTQPNYSRLVPGSVSANRFSPAKYLGSAMLRGVVESSGFALLAPGINPAGSTVEFIAFPW